MVNIRRENDKIFMRTENLGIAINSVTVIRDGTRDVYFAITGDRCAVTDIHVFRSGKI